MLFTVHLYLLCKAVFPLRLRVALRCVAREIETLSASLYLYLATQRHEKQRQP